MTRWTIHLEDVETTARVGIHPHEREPQRLLVSVSVEADGPAKPSDIAQCVNYESIYDHVTKEWPGRAHTNLLETLAADFLAWLFAQSPSVQKASVSVAKPDIFAHAVRVAVSATWTRADYEKIKEKGVI